MDVVSLTILGVSLHWLVLRQQLCTYIGGVVLRGQLNCRYGPERGVLAVATLPHVNSSQSHVKQAQVRARVSLDKRF